jgi:2-keto-3-deoxy-L-rhamnonate aldolase RhmA
MNLKKLLSANQPLVGTFIKTPHFHNSEVLAHSDLDLLCLDAEHAPFGRDDIDQCILAARSQNKPVVVRVPNTDSSTILNVLDLGADGVVLPHILNANHAREVVKKCFYGSDGRGYAGSTRSAGYTTNKLVENLAYNQRETCVIVQIEDLEAVEEIDQICQVAQIDCIFIGRMDLTVALGQTDASHPSVVSAVRKVVESTQKHGKNCGMFVADLSELQSWIDLGVRTFLLGSDHSFMLGGARQLKQTFQEAVTQAFSGEE